MICDRSIHDDELASQPTLSQFENAIAVPNVWRLREMLIDPFIAPSMRHPHTSRWILIRLTIPRTGNSNGRSSMGVTNNISPFPARLLVPRTIWS